MAVVSPPLAIPIPRGPHSQPKPNSSTATTPSLQSVLDQKRHTLSFQSMRWSVSYDSEDSTPSTSLQSLLSIDSLEPCTRSHPLDEAPEDYLTDIDNDFFSDTAMLELVEPLPTESPLACSSPPRPLAKKPSFVSQLSNSLRSFATSTKKQTNELVFDIQPRLTDDRLPVPHKKQQQQQQRSDVSPDRELETFKVTSLSHSPSSTPLPSSTAVYRNREPRINSQFLRLYSHESASRQKGLLPEIAPEEEEIYMSNPAFYRGTNREFALLVRQRLWNCVVLPPREDALMDPVSQNDEYVFDQDMTTTTTTTFNDANDNNNNNKVQSLVSIPRQVKPWITLEDETEKNTRLGPRGVLAKGVQFTVKGWANARWMPTKV